MEQRIRNLMGLAAKSGKILSGEETCLNALKKGEVFLVIVASDASDNTKKKFNDKSNFRNVPIRFIGTKDELGNSIGKGSRATLAIIDKGFASKLIEYIDHDETRANY